MKGRCEIYYRHCTTEFKLNDETSITGTICRLLRPAIPATGTSETIHNQGAPLSITPLLLTQFPMKKLETHGRKQKKRERNDISVF